MKGGATPLPPLIFDYGFSSSPSPLNVSTVVAQATGRIDISVSSPGSAKYCKKIILAIPIGTEATDLSNNTPTVTINSADWSVSSAVSTSGLGLGNSTVYARFTFDARDSSVYKIDYNLVLSISVVTNEAVGLYECIVIETSSSDANSFTEKQSGFTLAKVTPTLYLDNLVATALASPTIPTTEFANAAPFRLQWESNGTWFQLYEKANSKPIYAGTETNFVVTKGTSSDATYFLQASMTGDPSGGNFSPIYLFDALSVTITNPNLTPENVSIADTLDVKGVSNVETLSVSDQLKVSKSTSLTGDVIVGDATTKASVLVHGNIHAQNGLPLTQQLVHKRPLYGIGGQAYFDYGQTPKDLIKVYAPFEYAVPPVQPGAKRKFRIYAVYTDFMQDSNASTLVVFKPAFGSGTGSASFILPITWGNYDAYRDAHSDNWLDGTPMQGHAQISVVGTGGNGRLAYLEMEAWDFFS